jgi:hypothetical protein
LYSHHRQVVNFEYIDTVANRKMNCHVPAFPLALAQAGPRTCA